MKGASKSDRRGNEAASSSNGDGKIKSPISTRSGRRLSSTGSAGPSPAMKTPNKQSPARRTPGNQGSQASPRVTPSPGSKVVTGAGLKVTSGRKVTPTRATRSNPASGSRGSVLDKLRANREKQEKLKKESKACEKLDGSVMYSPEPGKPTDSEEVADTMETESSELGDIKYEGSGKQDNKLSETGDEESVGAADMTSADNEQMDEACNTVILERKDSSEDIAKDSDVLEAKNAASEVKKPAHEECEAKENDDKDITKGNKPGEQKEKKNASVSNVMETVVAKEVVAQTTKGASKSMQKEVFSSATPFTGKTRNVSLKQESKSSSRSSVSYQSDGESSVKSEPGSTESTPKIPGIRTRLKTGSIHMNGTTTISVSKEKAEQENIMKQIAAKGQPSPPSKTPPISGKKRPVMTVHTPSPSDGIPSDHPPPKKRKIGRNDGSGEDNRNDYFCWLCHKEGTLVCCELCPRVYHSRCLGLSEALPQDWVCPECEKIMRAECVDTRSKAMEMLTLDQLCTLLRSALERMKHAGSEPFQKPVDTSSVPNYSDYIFHPMDLSMIEKNIKKKQYGCTEAFLADAKWILHNCIIYNGSHSKLTSSAKMMIKICKHEMNEIELCPDCYLNSCVRKNNEWFSETCRVPHTLVWAKLKGYPFWPSKALREADGQVDVRFFGAHDRSWVPVSQCFLLSKNIPTSLQKGKKNQGLDMAITELNLHVKKLRERFGSFEYAPFRTPYDKSDSYKPFALNVTTSPAKSVSRPSLSSQKTQSTAVQSTSLYAKPRPLVIRRPSAMSKTVSALRNKYNAIVTLKKLDASPDKAKRTKLSGDRKEDDDGDVEDCNETLHVTEESLEEGANKSMDVESESEKESLDNGGSPKADNSNEKNVVNRLPDVSIVDKLANKIKAFTEVEKDCSENSGGAVNEIKEGPETSHFDDESLDDNSKKTVNQGQCSKTSDGSKNVGNGLDTKQVKEYVGEKVSKSDNEKDENTVPKRKVDKDNFDNDNANNDNLSKDDKAQEQESKSHAPSVISSEKESKETYKRKLESMIISCKEKLGVQQISSESDQDDTEDENNEDEENDENSDSVSDDADYIEEDSGESESGDNEDEELGKTELTKEKIATDKVDIECESKLMDSAKDKSMDTDVDALKHVDEKGCDGNDKSEAEKAADKVGGCKPKHTKDESDDVEMKLTVEANVDANVTCLPATSKKHKPTENDAVSRKRQRSIEKSDTESSIDRASEDSETDENVVKKVKTAESAKRKSPEKESILKPVNATSGKCLDKENVIDNETDESDAERLVIDLEKETSEKPKTCAKDNTSSEPTGKSSKDNVQSSTKEPNKEVIHNVPVIFTAKIAPNETPVRRCSPTLESEGLEVVSPERPPGETRASTSAAQDASVIDKQIMTSAKVAEKFSQKLLESIQRTFDEMCTEVLKEQTSPENVDGLYRQLEQAKHDYSIEVAEMRHNFQLTIAEMKACWGAEKEQVSKALRAKLEAEKEAAVAEVKKKQWCAFCAKEAIFYCCWNTSYCDYPCQQNHWPLHMHTCLQTNKNKTSTGETTPSSAVLVTQSLVSSAPTQSPLATTSVPQTPIVAAISQNEPDHLRLLQNNISAAIQREEERRGESRSGVSPKYIPMSTPINVIQNVRQPATVGISGGMMFNVNQRQRFGVTPMQIPAGPHVSLHQQQQHQQQQAMGNRMVFSQPMIQQTIYPLQVQPQPRLLFQNPQQNMMAYGMPPRPF